MSTYYAIGCLRCREQADLTRTSGAAPGMSWMFEAEDKLPAFICKHEDHLGELRVYSEHDGNYSEFADF
jgi:hypothetical protein